MRKGKTLPIVGGVWAIDPQKGFERLLEWSVGDRASAFRAARARYQSKAEASAATDYSVPNGIRFINLHGVMTADDGLCSNGAQSIAAELQAAYDDPNVKGVVIRVRTIGGEVTAAEIINSAIKDRNKPVAALIDYSYSAGVYATQNCDRLFLNGPISGVGSIGCVYSFNKDGIKYFKDHVIEVYAAQSTDKNEEWRAALEGDFSKYRQEATDYADVFINSIASARSLSADRLSKVSTGKTFMANEAIELGLADEIGGMAAAVSFINSFNQSQITMANPFSGIVGQLNRLFGTELPETADEAAVTSALSGIAPTAERLSAAEAAVAASAQKSEAAASALETRLEGKLAELAASADVEAVKSGLEAQINALKAEKDALSARLAQVEAAAAASSAQADGQGLNENNPLTGLAAFSDEFEKNFGVVEFKIAK